MQKSQRIISSYLCFSVCIRDVIFRRNDTHESESFIYKNKKQKDRVYAGYNFEISILFF